MPKVQDVLLKAVGKYVFVFYLFPVYPGSRYFDWLSMEKDASRSCVV